MNHHAGSATGSQAHAVGTAADGPETSAPQALALADTGSLLQAVACNRAAQLGRRQQSLMRGLAQRDGRLGGQRQCDDRDERHCGQGERGPGPGPGPVGMVYSLATAGAGTGAVAEAWAGSQLGEAAGGDGDLRRSASMPQQSVQQSQSRFE